MIELPQVEDPAVKIQAEFTRLKSRGNTLLKDALKAIEIDGKSPKAFYRCGIAHFALKNYAESVRYLEKANKIAPTDSIVREKLALAMKNFRYFLFSSTIVHFDPAENSENEEVPDTYKGPRLAKGQIVDYDWCVGLMTFLKEQGRLHRHYVLELMQQLQRLLSPLPNLIEIDVPGDSELTVCGDLHGQFYDLVNIFEINHPPGLTNPYLFNGDFVDRGSFSVEVWLTLTAWKLCFPGQFHLIRGNHESRGMNRVYGFEAEVLDKYDQGVMSIISEAFCGLPLGAVLKERVLVVHGGLVGQEGVTLEQIQAVQRRCEPPIKGIMCDLLWSDPAKAPGFSPSKRGVGCYFGPDVAIRFLDSNGLQLLVRSHEVKSDGFELEANGRVITVFSAPNYVDVMKNRGAFLRFPGKTMKPKIVKFTEVPHPNVPAMKYAKLKTTEVQ